MMWMQEMTLDAEKDGDTGSILFCKLDADIMLLVIDIHSQTLPDIEIPKISKDLSEALCINYCVHGRCELQMKNGNVNFLGSGEMAIDVDLTEHSSASFFYPTAKYEGIQLFVVPGEKLDERLSFCGHDHLRLTEALQEKYSAREQLFVTNPDEQIQTCIRTIQEDALFSKSRFLLLLDVFRLLYLLVGSSFAEIERQTYFTGSQVKIVQLAMEILTEDLSKRYSASELAGRFGISESSLKNYFRGIYGKGYSEYLTELRMEKAASLLAKGGLKVAAVAAAVGYGNQSRFAKVFKTHYGVTPTEYSRRIKLEKLEKQTEA